MKTHQDLSCSSLWSLRCWPPAAAMAARVPLDHAGPHTRRESELFRVEPRVVGDEYADELWLQEPAWSSTAVAFSATAMLLPRATEHRVGDQRWPALAGTSAQITAWEDCGTTLGVPRTAVITEFEPVPIIRTTP